MVISRRGFLGSAAGLSAFFLAQSPQASPLLHDPPNLPKACLLAGSESSIALKESVAGYRSALAASGIACKTSPDFSSPAARLVILPGTAFKDVDEVRRLRGHLENGSTVLLESGAAFLSSAECDLQQRILKSELGLDLRPPVHLWEGEESFRQAPYVDYYWPTAVKVRDFSRVVPVDSAGGESIARFKDMSVAVKRRVGRGTLVFLGSPMGPHLLAGDREAGRWLIQLCASC